MRFAALVTAVAVAAASFVVINSQSLAEADSVKEFTLEAVE